MNSEKLDNFNSGVDTEYFLKLYSSNRRHILGYIMTLMPQRSEAEDILQEVTAVLWRKFDEFQPGTDFNAWARAIVRNKVMDYQKRKRLVCFSDHIVGILDQESPAVLQRVDFRMDALESCVEKLSHRDRMIIRMRYYENLAVQLIANHFKKSLISIYRSLGRIHKNLLQCIHHQMNNG